MILLTNKGSLNYMYSYPQFEIMLTERQLRHSHIKSSRFQKDRDFTRAPASRKIVTLHNYVSLYRQTSFLYCGECYTCILQNNDCGIFHGLVELLYAGYRERLINVYI